MEFSKVSGKIGEAVGSATIQAGVGYLAVWAFTSINPIVGAVFGAAYGLSSAALNPIFCAKDSSLSSQILGTALKIALSAKATMLVLGIALSLKTTLVVSFTVLFLPAISASLLATIGVIVLGILLVKKGVV